MTRDESTCPLPERAAIPGHAVTCHADVVDLLRDRRHSRDPARLPVDHPMRRTLGGGDGQRHSMLFMDPPGHTRLRGLVSRAFSPAVLDQLTSSIERTARDLVDLAARQQSFDVVEAIATPLPVSVIAHLLGVPVADRDDFQRWSRQIVHSLDPFASPAVRDQVRETRAQLRRYFARAAEARAAAPRDDLISALLAAESDGDRLGRDELIDMCVLLLVAGNITTSDLIANGLLALLQHPDQLSRLRASPDLVGSAVEEMLRYDPPVTIATRFVVDDVTIAGCPVGAGTYVGAQLARANRDPQVFPDPDRFDVGRRPNPHVSFGGGIHMCLGAFLARIEARCAFEAMLDRFSEIRLAVTPDALRWRRVPFFRGLEALPVVVESRR